MRMMYMFKSNMDWYQSKIGDHDKQCWEQTVEGKILPNIDSLPKRDFNNSERSREFLDIDLIKGSTFTKAVPSHTSYVRTWKGLVRILFLPAFYNWWMRHTTGRFFIAILFLYAAQVFVTVAYCYFCVDTPTSLFEVTNPLIFMFVLSVMHTQIVYTQSSAKTHLFKKASSAQAVSNPANKRNTNVKRIKKNPSKQMTKRKARFQPVISEASRTKPPIVHTRNDSTALKLSSDSSEGVEDLLRADQGLVYVCYSANKVLEDQDYDEEEGSVCSVGDDEGSIMSDDNIDAVPDVAVNAEQRRSPLRHAVHPAKTRKPKTDKQDVDTIAESEETSDLDSPTKACTSDTEWENNRVCNSDVAEISTDSSSEYLSDDQLDDELGAEGPISLKRKLSHSLAYVPSFYDKITCVIWEKGQCKKVDLSVIELGGQIERQVAMLDYDSTELLFCAVVFTILIASFPFLFRFYYSPKLREMFVQLMFDRQPPDFVMVKQAFNLLLGSSWQEFAIIVNGVLQRFFLCGTFCFLVSVAEKSYWQRLQFAKFFCYLTSARRSRKHSVPHFRLNKVKNIKIWLSLRAYLKKRGPQRSVEVIVGSVFGLMVASLAAMCVQLLTDVETYIQVYGNWELTLCCMALTCYLLRFYSLGTKITKKYRNLSTVITEQINLYLHMEHKPHKKEELLVANAVLKLAESLIKEIESPYKMSSTIVNPVVFNVTRVAMLSAFSAVISELLGFKLKLHKVKIS